MDADELVVDHNEVQSIRKKQGGVLTFEQACSSIIVIEDRHINACKKLYEKNKDNPDTQMRIRRNVARDADVYLAKVEPAEFWKQLVLAVSSSQTRSQTANNPLEVLRAGDFDIMKWDKVKTLSREQIFNLAAADLKRAVEKANGGMRASVNRKPEFIAHNADIMSLVWDDLLPGISLLHQSPQHWSVERAVANSITVFKGVGPKQARLILHLLGLTRYVVPFDSRVIRVLKEKIDLLGNFDDNWISSCGPYEALENIIFDLCERSGILPIIFDAVAFQDESED